MRTEFAAPSRHHLQPRATLSGLGPAVRQSLPLLQEFLESEVQVLVRVLVDASLRRRHQSAQASGRLPGTTIQVLNRGRRAARAWIHAILAGRIDQGTRHALLNSWLPELGLRAGAESSAEIQALFELCRGAAAGLICAEPQDNLIPEAKALHALDAVLAVHLGFVEVAVRNAWHKQVMPGQGV